MKRIITTAKGSPQLPPYQVPLDLLESTDVIEPNDLTLIGKSELDYHSWTTISPESCFCGKTLEQANKELNDMLSFQQRLVVARKA